MNFSPFKLLRWTRPARRRQTLARLKRTVLAAFTVAVASASVVAADPPQDRPNDPDTVDTQDLLLLGPLEPTRLRVRIVIDGVPFRTAWLDTFNRLFDQYDTDHDGRLSEEQAGQLSSVFGVTPVTGVRAVAAATPTNPAMVDKARLTRPELREKLEQTRPPFRLVQNLSSSGAGPALIPLLDTNGDGRLSREELNDAVQSLHGRDFNDDQLITEQELVAGPVLAETTTGETNWVNNGSVALLNRVMDATAIAELLLSRYDRNRDGNLSLKAPAEIFAGEGGLASLDADNDQQLSRTELRAYVDLPYDAELPFVLGGGGTRMKEKAAPRYRLRRKQFDGGYRLHVGSREINFGRNNRNPDQEDARPRMTEYDGDQSGSLDSAEFAMVADHPDMAVVDSDRDGKVSTAEFDAFFALRSKAASVQILLEATEQGSDLFKSLDLNSDRVLTPRELVQAAKLLETDDQDHDGFLGGEEMTYNLSLMLLRGSPRTVTNAQFALRPPSQPRVKADRTGPAWFLKMDRNRDGDVGLPEFTGSRQKFAEIDTNHDGLLSADEASAITPAAK